MGTVGIWIGTAVLDWIFDCGWSSSEDELIRISSTLISSFDFSFCVDIGGESRSGSGDYSCDFVMLMRF